jgi:hypothetical protein
MMKNRNLSGQNGIPAKRMKNGETVSDSISRFYLADTKMVGYNPGMRARRDMIFPSHFQAYSYLRSEINIAYTSEFFCGK